LNGFIGLKVRNLLLSVLLMSKNGEPKQANHLGRSSLPRIKHRTNQGTRESKKEKSNMYSQE
jgi:hypothetical protein